MNIEMTENSMASLLKMLRFTKRTAITMLEVTDKFALKPDEIAHFESLVKEADIAIRYLENCLNMIDRPSDDMLN